MKPAFALDFRNDSVSLLHRSAGGWQLLGKVALDTPDLPEALTYLRSTALGLSPKSLTSKLIIPNEQILYTRVTAPGPTAAERLAQVTKALEGRTPYEVADLAFDILGEGPEVIVAVIAKETLAEAEAFAVEHRFNPVSFVAVPEMAEIRGEPWFGMTTGAENYLGAGKKVERDKEAVAIAQPPAAPEAEPAPQPEPAQAPEIAAAAAPVVAPEIAAAPEPAPAPETAAAVQAPEAPAAPEQAPQPVQPQLDLPAPQSQPLAAARPAPPATDAATDRELIARLGDTLAQPIAQPPLASPASLLDIDEAPMALDVAPDEGSDDEPQGADIIRAALSGKSARVTETTIDDPQPVTPAVSGLMGFSSRRVDATAAAGKAPSLGAAPSLRASSRPAAKAAAAPKAAGLAKRGMGALSSAATATANAAKRQKVELPAASANAAATMAAAPEARKALPKGPGGFALRKPVRGKPRYLGLILTVVLLFLLAMVAAWSSYSLGAWNTAPDLPEPAQTEAVQTAGAAPEAIATPDLAQTAQAVSDAADEIAADLQDSEAIADGQATPALDPSPQDRADAPLIEQTAPVAAAALGMQDEIYLAAMDAPPTAPDPLSLPLPETSGDTMPVAQAAPPPFGTVYQFAENGSIRPTPEGIITPEGVMLRAGRPPLVPAERPLTAAPTGLPAAAALAAAVPVPVPAIAFADPALAGKLPKPRPANLVPARPADQGSLAPEAGSRLAGLRPQPRPQQVLAAGETARQASAAATLSSAASLLAPASASPQAVAISRKPAARPRDMSRAVEAAIASAMLQPDAALASSTAGIAQQPAAPEAEADGEPEVVASNQKTPLRTTVAKQATYKNALNMSQTNLIGVYGTQSSRYALVRQSNGRYKKVRVGDSIDGGRVAAITPTEVRYQKGNRLIALAMPKD